MKKPLAEIEKELWDIHVSGYEMCDCGCGGGSNSAAQDFTNDRKNFLLLCLILDRLPEILP